MSEQPAPESARSHAWRIALTRAIEAAAFALVALAGQYEFLRGDLERIRIGQYMCDGQVEKLQRALDTHIKEERPK